MTVVEKGNHEQIQKTIDHKDKEMKGCIAIIGHTTNHVDKKIDNVTLAVTVDSQISIENDQLGNIDNKGIDIVMKNDDGY